MTPDEIATRATASGADISGMVLMDAVATAAEALQTFPRAESLAYSRAAETAAEAVTSATVIRDIDNLIAERDANAEAFAAAVGFYDCPCGSEFEFFTDSGLAEYGALNRWIGEHVGKCTGDDAPLVELFVQECADCDKAKRERDDAIASRDNMIDMSIEVGRIGNYLKHAVAEKDELSDMLEEMRHNYHASQCRMDEMAQTIRDLESELATARNERDNAAAWAAHRGRNQ